MSHRVGQHSFMSDDDALILNSFLSGNIECKWRML